MLEKKISPKKNQLFIWFAKSYDDSILTEFEEDLKENSFTDIDKENLKEFGFIGRGAKLYFNTDDGIIHLELPNGKSHSIELFLYDSEQTLIKITGREFEKYKDIIQFKRIYFDMDPSGSTTNSGINGYIFGYKLIIDVPDKGKIHAQIKYNMPMDDQITLDTRIAPTFDFTGNLFVRVNGETTMVGELNVKKNSSTIIKTKFK